MDAEKYGNDLSGEVLNDVRSIVESHSETIKKPCRSGSLIVRLPVVISQTRVHMDMESKVKLPQRAREINICKREAYITQCKILNMNNGKYGKIYINGYIRERVEYADVECPGAGEASGIIRFIAVRIPFDCIAKVEYCLPPVFKATDGFVPVELISSSSVPREAGVLTEQYRAVTAQSDPVLCEAVDIKVQEACVFRESLPQEAAFPAREAYDEITEHILVSITFLLMQRQMVCINGY